MNTEIYSDFLKSKIKQAKKVGIIIEASEINSIAKPHQKDIIQWAAHGGKRAVFAQFGLGKTLIQCELARIIRQREGGRFLIICPLGVKQEFSVTQAQMLGMDIPYVKTTLDVLEVDSPITITNYERVRDGQVDVEQLINMNGLIGVSLDEADVLRSIGSDTTQQFINKFRNIKYKFVCTATPSPNEYLEIINYADFLGVMDRGQALTRFFQRNSQKAGELTLHPAHEKDFWLWVSSWAIFLNKPSDLGYSDEGYSLPEMEVNWHCVKVDPNKFGVMKEKDGQVKAFADSSNSLPEAAKIKRASIDERLENVFDIVEIKIFGHGQGSETGIHEGVSENLSTEEINSGTEGGKEQIETREVCNGSGISNEGENSCENLEQEISGEENESEINSGIRHHDSGLQGEVDSSELSLRNLREREHVNGEEQVLRGSLSQDESSERAPLSKLQLRIRAFQRRYQSFVESNGLPKQFIVFCTLNEEHRILERSFKASGISLSSLTGGESPDLREEHLFDWLDKKTTALVSKPTVAGSGLNLQQSSHMIFMGIDYKFKDFIQAVHRIHRFLQKETVVIDIIYTEQEQSIKNALIRKWELHNKQQEIMSDIIRTYGLDHSKQIAELHRSMGCERQVVWGNKYLAINNDSCIELPTREDNSVGLIHTSIPFGNHYEYSASYNDFGHNDNNQVFWHQMDFLIPELHRVLKPGRNAIIHVKDRIRYGTMTGEGMTTLDPFSDECTTAFRKHGFLFMGRITIVTDVVRENNQTYRLGHSEKCKDASKMGCGLPEYLLIFRKGQTDKSKGYADEPVLKSKADYGLSKWQTDASSFWRSSGNRLLEPKDVAEWEPNKIMKWFKEWSKSEVYDYEKHIALADKLAESDKLSKTFSMLQPQSWDEESVWTGINYMHGLNASQRQKKAENHICPLPFDIVNRVIECWSMEGDTVLDPFAGLMTVPMCAIKKKRHAIGIELNPDYYRWGCGYLRDTEIEMNVPTLFDLDKTETAIAV